MPILSVKNYRAQMSPNGNMRFSLWTSNASSAVGCTNDGNYSVLVVQDRKVILAGLWLITTLL